MLACSPPPQMPPVLLCFGEPHSKVWDGRQHMGAL